jgi:hypothetical protein
MLKPSGQKKQKKAAKTIDDQLVTNSKKAVIERAGDWTCQQCLNHNFSFREECNKCHLSR